MITADYLYAPPAHEGKGEAKQRGGPFPAEREREEVRKFLFIAWPVDMCGGSVNWPSCKVPVIRRRSVRARRANQGARWGRIPFLSAVAEIAVEGKLG